MTRLRIGYVPLTDAALLFVARDHGFAAAHGLTLDLVAEPSWANIRDRLALGHFDAAHMLAPATIAAALGLNHMQAPLAAAVGLGRNGNAITLAPTLAAELYDLCEGSTADPGVTARALARIVSARRRRGLAPLTLAFVFPFSSHHYQLRLWLRAGGLDPDHDLRLIVLPPPWMVPGIESQQIDGFAVGAPWNSLAAHRGAGTIVHFGCEIINNCPEKVLAYNRATPFGRTATAGSMLATMIREAAAWSADEINAAAFAQCAAAAADNAMPASAIAKLIAGDVTLDIEGRRRHRADYLRFDAESLEIGRKAALWCYAQMVAAGQTRGHATEWAAAAEIFGDDGKASANAPTAFAGPPFDPAQPEVSAAALAAWKP